MRILDNIYMTDYLKKHTVSYRNWQVLAEICFDKGFDDKYINYINSVLSANVLINNPIEKMDYQNMRESLILLKFDIINQHNSIKIKNKNIKKIQISA